MLTRNSVRLIAEAVFRSPGVKAVLNAASVVIAGVLTSAFVSALNSGHGVVWSHFYKEETFYLLLAFVFIEAVYQRALYAHEVNIERFADAEYCTAYMRSQC